MTSQTEQAGALARRIEEQLNQVLVGQPAITRQVLIALITGGHVLIEGVPGLGKTLLARSLARVLELDFQRIQFTPDLMPSDVTGHALFDSQSGDFRVRKGPAFTNLLLADEINRTPPKTQAALLQAMQEGKVTAAGHTYTLDPPFLCFATQNPIEQEGTYPLPEAQLDRFMFQIEVGYPTEAEEREIVSRTTGAIPQDIEPVLSPEKIIALQNLVRRVPVGDHVVSYAVKLTRSTRPGDDGAPDFVKEYVGWGAGPRASQYLILAGKARALLDGRLTVAREDIRALAPAVLSHRVITNFHAESERVTTADVLRRLLETVPMGSV